MKILRKLPVSITLLFWMTLVTGVAYPLVVTGIAQLAFPQEANGSLILLGGQVRGSSLLAQKVESRRFFKARPSATDYAYIGSGASNLAATNKALAEAVAARTADWQARLGSPGVQPPQEMLYASASGLDPEISLEAALAQLPGVTAARGYTEGQRASLEVLIRRAAKDSETLLGMPRVNVTSLNARLESDPGLAGPQ